MGETFAKRAADLKRGDAEGPN